MVFTPQEVEAPALKKAPKRLTLLSAIEHVIELSHRSCLNDEYFSKAKKYTNFLARKLKLTPTQVTLLGVYLDNCTDDKIGMSDLSQHLGCRNITVLRLLKDIAVLEQRQFIRYKRKGKDKIWRVPYEVLQAFEQNKMYVPQVEQDLTCEELMNNLDALLEQLRENELDINLLHQEVYSLLDANAHLLFSRQMQMHRDVNAQNLALILLFCIQFVNDNDDRIGFIDFAALYDTKYEARKVKSQLCKQENYWQLQGYIENSIADGFLEKEHFKLTDKAKTEWLSELNINQEKPSPLKGVIAHDTIAQKQLHYNENEQLQIQQLTSLLQPENFKMVQQRLTEGGMRKGFTCLFYGEPGTGKTETVYQLAKQTCRNIVEVNIAKMRSCWVGESEKNIKTLFDNYRNTVKHAKDGRVPILLFNEADALINQRMEGSARAIDKMENTMQNIILQEMETLEGILIATTNLTQNLDRAFERRFLYKIEFTKPCAAVKQTIWQEMLPKLTDEQAQFLSFRYDFSGGQIENIVRKQTVDAILYGNSDTMEYLVVACNNEQLKRVNTRKPIGFR
ncbi:MAG: ATP-binding protein [Mediterranea sp.]|jgi:hypothetical protein|nr:ATP-binding protein [Mediterranea sp.]